MLSRRALVCCLLIFRCLYALMLLPRRCCRQLMLMIRQLTLAAIRHAMLDAADAMLLDALLPPCCCYCRLTMLMLFS